jgi:hypothetical protein
MSLLSVTESQVLNGSNLAAIGTHGRWEIIAFKTATLNPNGTYTLSGLLRGLKGTEHNTGNHATGDSFVLLESGRLVRVQIDADDIGVEKYWKVATIGENLVQFAGQAFTCGAVGLECFSPAHLRGQRNASGDLTISWIRRNRLAGEWRDLVDVPVSENTEQYEIDVMAGETVKRTITVTDATSASYTASMQTTDFGSTQASVTVKIYQISATVGRGYVASATL